MSVYSQRLIHSAPATPTREQLEIYRACYDRARRAGLTLPDPLDVRWRHGDQSCPDGVIVDGVTTWRPGHGVCVYFCVGDPQLAETVYHELQHVSDYVSQTRRHTIAALERRAETFAMTMLSETTADHC